MRTTIEIKPEHRAKLLALAARRGTKGFSELVSEALEAYLRAESDREAQRRRAVLLKGTLPAQGPRRYGFHRRAPEEVAMMVADTDVLIDFLDGRAPAAARIALEIDRGLLRTTVITGSSSWRVPGRPRSRG